MTLCLVWCHLVLYLRLFEGVVNSACADVVVKKPVTAMLMETEPNWHL